MRQQAKDRLMEYKGDPASDSPFVWDDLLSRAANQFATRYKCLYDVTGIDIVSGQALYSTTASYGGTTGNSNIELVCASAYDASGNRHTLDVVSVAAMDDQYPVWRDQAAATAVTAYIPLGMNSLVLYPAPGYASAYDPTGQAPGGLILEGYVIPGNSWGADGAECPLPTDIHDAVIDQAALFRIAQNPTDTNMKRAEMLTAQMRETLGAFESRMWRATIADRHPAYVGSGPVGYAGTDGNPLDF